MRDAALRSNRHTIDERDVRRTEGDANKDALADPHLHYFSLVVVYELSLAMFSK